MGDLPTLGLSSFHELSHATFSVHVRYTGYVKQVASYLSFGPSYVFFVLLQIVFSCVAKGQLDTRVLDGRSWVCLNGCGATLFLLIFLNFAISFEFF